jgi:hypothetical protein
MGQTECGLQRVEVDRLAQVRDLQIAALRVRYAGSGPGKQRLHPQQWLLIEWP